MRNIPHAIGIAIGAAAGAVIMAAFAGAVAAVKVAEKRKAAQQRRQDNAVLAPYESEFQ